jgi:hypothetical protein
MENNVFKVINDKCNIVLRNCDACGSQERRFESRQDYYIVIKRLISIVL